jgi:predicted nucleic acid-binding protein
MPVFDSNIVIYHLNDALPPAALTRVAAWMAAGATISVITRIEVLGYPQTAAQLQQATDLLSYLAEMPLSEAIVQRTITLRQQHRIRLPDALIAATALELGEPLVTRNTQDFHAIEGLVLLNPFTAEGS